MEQVIKSVNGGAAVSGEVLHDRRKSERRARYLKEVPEGGGLIVLIVGVVYGAAIGAIVGYLLGKADACARAATTVL